MIRIMGILGSILGSSYFGKVPSVQEGCRVDQKTSYPTGFRAHGLRGNLREQYEQYVQDLRPTSSQARATRRITLSCAFLDAGLFAEVNVLIYEAAHFCLGIPNVRIRFFRKRYTRYQVELTIDVRASGFRSRTEALKQNK